MISGGARPDVLVPEALTVEGSPSEGSLPDLALALLAAPGADTLGGAVVIAPGAEEAERWIAALQRAVRHARPEAPWQVVPSAVSDDRLAGGVDVVATLARGTRVIARGLLAESHQGVVVMPRVTAASAATLARLAAALDTGSVVPGEGADVHDARITVVAVACGEEEAAELPSLLVDRLALVVELPRGYTPAVRTPAPDGSPAHAPIATLCGIADTLGVASLRASVFAVRVARALARQAGRDAIQDDDLASAVQLVLAPRATRDPAADRPPPPDDPTAADEPSRASDESPSAAPTPPAPSDDAGERTARPLDDADLRELLIAAARTALPPNLLASVDGAAARATSARSAPGRAVRGQRQADDRRGRRVGTRPGHPRGGHRLDLVETLRVAAPWQRVRGRAPGAPLAVRTGDLRVERRRRPLGTTTVVVVDASGSAALGRLAEAKGAAELLLAESYARRDHVALVAFRGSEATVLLPPTRALARARRVVSALPAGGGTPLAAALVSAADLARATHRGGARPAVVLLTDGRGNIALDGTPGRAKARADAHAAARVLAETLRAAGGLAVVVDTAVRGGADARDLATAAGARYLALPHVSARALHGAIHAALAEHASPS